MALLSFGRLIMGVWLTKRTVLLRRRLWSNTCICCLLFGLIVNVSIDGQTDDKSADSRRQVAGRCLRGHAAPVTAVAISGKGALLLSGSADGITRLWDAATGRGLREFPNASSGVQCVAFDATERDAVVSYRDGWIRAFDLQSGRIIRRFKAYTCHGGAVVCSADERYAVTEGGDYTGFLREEVASEVKLWQLSPIKEVRRFKGHVSGVNSVALSTDGRHLLTGAGHLDGLPGILDGTQRIVPTDCTMRLWDVSTGRQLSCFQGHTATVKSVGFSRNGLLAVSGSYDKTLRVWDLQTRKQLACLAAQRTAVWSVAFCGNDRYVVSSGGGDVYQRDGTSRFVDCTVRVWDWSAGRQITCFDGHTAPVVVLAAAPDGTFAASGSDDRTIRIWPLPKK
jgi:WD40 repeat protein